jgi:peptidoglycan hydrolase-like protein with peptidoglycan-binding domain
MRVAETLSIGFFALALVGCAHAKTTEPAEPEAAEKPSSTARAPRTGKLRVAPTGEQPKTTPLAQAPEGLLKPGAEQKIHDKLSAGGFVKEDANDSTEAALRRFQAAHDLPATGVPDHETVRRLGLNPDDLFRKAAT